MENLTIEEQLIKYPYLKNMAQYTIFTTSDDIDKIKNSEKIKVDNEVISIEFLKRILQDATYYDYAKRYFDKKINSFCVSYIIGGDTAGSIYYPKVAILKGIEELTFLNKLILQPIEKERLASLQNSISFQHFLEERQDQYYNIVIDQNKYTIPIRQIIDLMQMSEEEFTKLCQDKNIDKINNIPKEHFIYAAYKYFKTNNVLEEYLMPKKIEKRFKDIGSLQIIDLQAINKHLETEDTKYKDVVINPDLEKEIMMGMPKEANTLEKAIYIYIKLCKILTYDDEYYAVNQKGEAAQKHQDIGVVSNITPQNNKVVCYEFNLLYSKLLDSLGIKFRSDYENMVGEAYGAGHANLEFRWNKYLVRADSVTSILKGDLVQAKLNEPLNGLNILNYNKETQEEFKEMVKKMYTLIIEEEKKDKGVENVGELLNEYAQATANIKEIPLKEKLDILLTKVNTSKMEGIDALSYILHLRKILFKEEERQNNMGVTIIRNGNVAGISKIAEAIAIITLNEQGFMHNPEQNIYYYFAPNMPLVNLSKEELEEKFRDGTFAYVEKDDPRIPGILEEEGIKR